MSWFEEWFDSPLYEKLYANRNEDEAALLADLIEKEIPVKDYSEVLDLGCGRGRHSINLAERGYKVTGVDLSEEAIIKAKKKAAGKNLTNIEFFVGDMRDPLGRRFDAILNLFTTFGYFLNDVENVRVLKNIHHILKKNGLVMIDFLNAAWVKRNIVPEESGSFRDFEYKIERKIEAGMVFKTITFTGPSIEKPVKYQERVKLYDPGWFSENLTECGFKLKNIYGDYHGGEFKEKSSQRLILISRKG